MGTQYSQITIEERCEMARLRTAGHSIRQVAASLDRSPSTVSRELKRNGSRTRGIPAGLCGSAGARPPVARVPLDPGCGPPRPSSLSPPTGVVEEQVAGRLALESGKKVISHETIYRFIYAQLPARRTTPGVTTCHERSRNGGGGDARAAVPASFIHLRRPLSERPKAASDRHHPATGKPI